MAKEKILITVKTYPTLSKKYEELVCTAGFKEDGSWVRLYPIPFRKLSYAQQYSKFEWLEVDITRNAKDFRPETYYPKSEPKILGKIGTENAWAERKKIIFKKHKIFTNLKELIAEAKDKNKATSLAIFKPTEILDVIVESCDKDWDPKKLEMLKQGHLFEKVLKPVSKLPFKFSYKFKDDSGRQSTMMIEDWELGALFWNCRKKDDEKATCQKVKQKYLDKFRDKDLHLFLGTTKLYHFTAPNPFVIIGVLPLPKTKEQSELF
jgi:hypothetical protein